MSAADAAATDERLQALAVERDTLASQRDRMERERDEYRKLYLSMLELNRKLELGLRGQKAEKLSPGDAQIAMAMLATMLVEPLPAQVDPAEEDEAQAPNGGAEGEAPPEEDGAKDKPQAKRGRKALPAELPRVEIRILPPEVEREGIDHFEQIGEEVCEVIERRKASLVVVRVVRPKFVRKDRERNAETEVLAAPAAELPIERGIAGPGVLAETIVRRFDDHLPANRQERIRHATEWSSPARRSVPGTSSCTSSSSRCSSRCGKTRSARPGSPPTRPASSCRPRTSAKRVTSGQ